MLNILCGFIKTDSVIVNTDEIIDSYDKLNATSKYLSTFKDEAKFMIEAPNNSFLNQLYKKKIKNNEIYLLPLHVDDKLRETMLGNRMELGFFFSEKLVNLLILSLASVYITDRIVFVKPFNYYENFKVIYLRKSLEASKKAFFHRA